MEQGARSREEFDGRKLLAPGSMLLATFASVSMPPDTFSLPGRGGEGNKRCQVSGFKCQDSI
jgi:hypothetical protein